MRLKGDVEWFERRLQHASGAARLLLENPGLEMRSGECKTWITGDMLEGGRLVPVRISMTDKYGELSWARAWGWLDRETLGFWKVTDAARAALYDAHPGLDMLLEIRAAMYESARNGTLPSGPPAGI